MTLAVAESMISSALRSGATSDVRLLERTALDLRNLEDDPPKQLALMLDAVRFFYVSGMPAIGVAVAESAKEYAGAQADAVSMAKAAMLLGLCCADTGNLPRAMEAYSAALILATSTQDFTQQAKIWHNLSGALVYCGLFKEAIGCVTKIAEIAEFNMDVKDQILPPALALNALCYLSLDEIASGLAAIERAVAVSKPPIDAHSIQNRVLAENYYARLLIEISDFEGALTHARTARELSEQKPLT